MTDPDRLEEVIAAYENTLYRAALAVLGDAHEAEDAVQDAFLRYLEKAPDFPDTARERAWLLKVAVNGEALPLEGASAARVEDGRLMVPVRLLAETLGCEVTWEAYINQVSVSKGGSEIYHFTIGGEQAAKGDVTVGLVSAARADGGVTLMALDDLIVLHGLKLADGWDG